ncbi:MAG: aspartate--tRNA ligase [Candidatus Harrisonbacteria bacterium CG10_big_fil_rev_8_21_14_0_10_42_17]|uniref:Aspartate--tRNA(Asp/Asn) ligase n=1 Tax=Candidatus Harrisonbacteria bacterium CG10_big_fil_rev_8_21_14_0_10_42_17 TaxID=1974584 RepID=A0A2M6WIX9_9BACT|nr:MAG: aspartate--tRNA ligase [Candidatus Harrisonbacteria bacterium CG10_big_fil_rev_8_21_14_0_10_42_17]
MRHLVRDISHLEGQEIHLSGWVHVRRDHGKIIFIDIRDRTGIAQLVVLPSDNQAYEQANRVRDEWVIRVRGTVQKRPEKLWNEKLESGKYEVHVQELEVLNESKTPPFPLDTEGRDIEEELRLKYRYMDLRRTRMQKNIKLRSQFVDRVRQFYFSKEFLEIETPMLTKSTPEGSRDFVVPSRLHPGKYFALPQSPQQYKQLLMASGFERYFQIARAIRDEDLRADRGFEHTQIDMEMSFADREEVMHLNEEMIMTVVESMGYTLKEKSFPIITYAQAMERYGADKFDVRNDEEKEKGILAFSWVIDFPFFEKNKEGKWTFTHNPFSHPKQEHVEMLLKGEHIDHILTSQYDLVCNGYEVGGGSIRAHTAEILQAVFKIMGYEEPVIREQFGHMLEAFSYGAPPHGGIAMGVDRLVMILTGEQYLREVVAFPQTGSGKTSIMDAPSELSPDQLAELKINIDRDSI